MHICMTVVSGRMFAKQMKTYNNGPKPEKKNYVVSCIYWSYPLFFYQTRNNLGCTCVEG